MAEQLSTFRRQIRCLFAEKGCLGSGYTNLALSHLRRTKLVPVPGHSPVALGGQGAVSPETVTDCLGIKKVRDDPKVPKETVLKGANADLWLEVWRMLRSAPRWTFEWLPSHRSQAKATAAGVSRDD